MTGAGDSDLFPLLTLHGGGQLLTPEGKIFAAETPRIHTQHSSAEPLQSPQTPANLAARADPAGGNGVYTPRSIYASHSSHSSSHQVYKCKDQSGVGQLQHGLSNKGEAEGGVTGECVRVLEGHEDAVMYCLRHAVLRHSELLTSC